MKPFCILLGVLAYIALFYFLPQLKEFLLFSEQNVRGLNTPTTSRVSIWVELFGAVVQGPLWGYGWNQVSVAQVLVESASSRTVYVEHSHNLFLDLLIWNGPVIGLICILAICYWVFQQINLCKTREQWFLLVMIMPVAIHSLLEFPIEYAYFFIPVFFMVGMLELSAKKDVVFSLGKFYQGFIVIMFAACLWVFFQEYRIIEKEFLKTRMASARIGGNVDVSEKAPDVVVLTQLREFIRFTRTEAAPNMSAEKLEWMRKVSHRYAYPPALFRYALALGLNGRVTEAEKIMLVIKRIHGDKLFNEAKDSLEMLGREKYPQLKNIQIP